MFAIASPAACAGGESGEETIGALGCYVSVENPGTKNKRATEQFISELREDKTGRQTSNRE
jgi:hypothetical protein